MPINEATNDYKDYLDKKLVDKNQKDFLSYVDNNTDLVVDFELTFDKEVNLTDEYIVNNFKLRKKYSTNNMHMFNQYNIIEKYQTTDDVFDEFYEVRYDCYVKRKEYQLQVLLYQRTVLENKVKFITMIVKKTLDINDKTKQVIIGLLEKNNFDKLGKNYDDDNISYDYLLHMQIYNLSKEKIIELENKMNEKIKEYDDLYNKDVADIWLEELDHLENEYKKWMKEQKN